MTDESGKQGMNELEALWNNQPEAEKVLTQNFAVFQDNPALAKSVMEQVSKVMETRPELKEEVFKRIQTKEHLLEVLKHGKAGFEKAFQESIRTEKEKNKELDELAKQTDEHIERMLKFTDETQKAFTKASSVYDSLIQTNDQFLSLLPPEVQQPLVTKVNEIIGMEGFDFQGTGRPDASQKPLIKEPKKFV
jgi:Mg2+ and Co2+ transporter CorA